MTKRYTTTMRNSLVDLLVDAIDVGTNGNVEIRTGSQPASANDAATGTLLVTLQLPDPAFGAAASGTATFNAVTAVNAAATGTAGWFRVKASAGTVIMDGSVTATGGGGDMEITTTALASGNPVDITAWTVTAPGG